jgi:signal transduction histidine kinase/ABC-type amino acid transport substrate-binding protein/ActR/RegA family two-component response regulator/HPt (histidine-containing phosphotransfer) domain-containing protein
MKVKILAFLMLCPFLLLFGQGQETLVFGIVPTSPPAMFLDEHNLPSGFAVELFTRVMDDLQIPYTFKVNSISRTYQDLITGEVDLFPSLIYTDVRAQFLYFPKHPILTTWGALFVNEGTVFHEITNIQGKTIGIVKDDQNGKNFISFINSLNIHCQIKEFDSYEKLFRSVRLNNIYGGISNNHQQLAERGIKQTAVVFQPENVYCVTGLEGDHKETIDQISRYIYDLKSHPNSYYYRLEKKWYYPNQNGEINIRIKRLLMGVALITLLIVIHLFVYNRFLIHKVKKQVKEREKNRDKQKKVDLKNDFLSSISHELRTPMNIISSLVYLLSQTDLDENQRDKIDQIDKASFLLLDIIKNFLDFNRLEKGKMELENRTFSLIPELEAILNLFTSEIRQKGLNFEKIIDENIPQSLLGDPYRLIQVITNLLNNAVKFSNRGKITFSVETSHITGKECLLKFSVRDQGIGMNPEQLKKLYTPFTQADSSISRQFGGSGLGMAICNQLIQLMNGTIEVESHEGEGTCISFFISFGIGNELDEEVKNSKRKKLHHYRGARLLYVEDNRVNRNIGRELFQMAEMEIETAENGLDALNILSKSQFDLILMDIQMPFMDGLTATEKLREKEKDENLSPTTVVALSAHFLQEDIDSALKAGMNDYLTKPISVHELNDLFDKWLPQFIGAGQKKLSLTTEYTPFPGIDMDDVMDRFGGNYELLRDSLGSFINDYALMPSLLISLKDQGDKEALRERIHTLKGVMGSLGAGKLYEKANSLERNIITEEESIDDIRLFSQDLEYFITQLQGNV